MIYEVQARFKSDTAAEFRRELTDGTIECQDPDGREIVASMKRAKINDDGLVRWSEKCFCSTPLQHERETVYDCHFTDLQTEQIDDYVEMDGQAFMVFLEEKATA